MREREQDVGEGRKEGGRKLEREIEREKWWERGNEKL